MALSTLFVAKKKKKLWKFSNRFYLANKKYTWVYCETIAFKLKLFKQNYFINETILN